MIPNNKFVENADCGTKFENNKDGDTKFAKKADSSVAKRPCLKCIAGFWHTTKFQLLALLYVGLFMCGVLWSGVLASCCLKIGFSGFTMVVYKKALVRNEKRKPSNKDKKMNKSIRFLVEKMRLIHVGIILSCTLAICLGDGCERASISDDIKNFEGEMFEIFIESRYLTKDSCRVEVEDGKLIIEAKNDREQETATIAVLKLELMLPKGFVEATIKCDSPSDGTIRVTGQRN